MMHFNELKSEIFLYHTVSYSRATFHLLVAKVYVMTVAHYVTKIKKFFFT